MPTNNTGRKLQTVETAFTILESLQNMEGARVKELANQLDMAESTVHGYLSTLYQNGYLIKDGDEYNAGLKFLTIGGYAQHRATEYELAGNKTADLAEKTDERAQFVVEEHGRGIHVHTKTGSNAVQVDARIGKQNYLHASAAGKAILAHYSQSTVETIIDRWGLPELTENTIGDRGTLLEELQDIKKQGYSFNKEESTQGLHAVGVPIKKDTDQVIGALSVSGPSNRLQGDVLMEEIPELLLGVANELELKIKYET